MDPIRFPGETASYRSARDELLRGEQALRRQLEVVAAARRRLPLGGPVPEDYVFEEGARNLDDASPAHSVRLSELFAPGKEALVLYNFMFSPEMDHACPMCSCLLDGLNGNARHIEQRVNLAVVAKSPVERIRDFARRRPWRNLRLLSSEKMPSTATTTETPKTARKTASSTPSSSAMAKCTTSTAQRWPSGRAT